MCLRALETALGQLQKSRVIRSNFTGQYKRKSSDKELVIQIKFWIKIIFLFCSENLASTAYYILQDTNILVQ